MASELKYYLEYLERNNKLVIENQLYLDPSTGNFGVGSSGFTYKLTVTGDTYSEQYYMRTPDTGTSNNILIYEGGKIKMKTASTGTSGTSGTSGKTGTSGTSGTSGSSGTSGTSGTSGKTGTSGTSGTSGLTGTSGKTGTAGSSGVSSGGGSSGTSFINVVEYKVTTYNVTLSDAGKTFVVSGTSVMTQYFNLPTLATNSQGLEYTFIKLNTNAKVIITANSGDYIEDSYSGCVIYCNDDGYASLTLKLAYQSGGTSGKWIIKYGNGIWITTTTPI